VTTQVLMLDTSDSMFSDRFADSRRKRRHMKSAAKAYVRWMEQASAARRDGGAESLMVVTFDDTLRMVIPPTVVDDPGRSRRLQQRIGAMGGGFLTRLRDSLVRVVRHLDGAPGRSAVLLLSDGADRASKFHGPDEVYRTLREANRVTVFPILVGVDKGPHRRFMEEVARISGGRAYSAATRVDDKFRRIHQRLAGQRYVSYLTHAPAAGERGTFRKVRIRLAADSALRQRCALPDDGYRRERFLAGDGVIDDRDVAPPPLAIVPESSAGSGFRYDPETLELLVDAPRRPEDIVHDWLRLGQFESPHAARFEMNGDAFLDRMPQLAAEVYAHYPVLREWVQRRRRARIEADLRRRVPPPTNPDEQVAYESTLQRIGVREAARPPATGFRYELASWLGDIDARELALRLERKEANLLLAGTAEAVATAEAVQQEFARLASWLPYSDSEPVIALLELVCAPERDACGYWRVVRPRTAELVRDASNNPIWPPETADDWLVHERAGTPTHPLGLMAVRWLLGLPTHPDASDGAGSAAAALREWRVEALDHEPVWLPEGGRPRGRGSKRPDCRHRVRLDLEPAAAASDGRRSARLELVLDGRVADDSSPRGPARCATSPAPLRIEVRCVREPETLPAELGALLADRQVSACRD
jgi:hypothetical protein